MKTKYNHQTKMAVLMGVSAIATAILMGMSAGVVLFFFYLVLSVFAEVIVEVARENKK